jgi:hypothetical protein
VGGAGGARRFDYLRVVAAWRERSKAHTVQVRACFRCRFEFLIGRCECVES